jgi:hypothetical protein
VDEDESWSSLHSLQPFWSVDEEDCHYTMEETSFLFGGPLSDLYRARFAIRVIFILHMQHYKGYRKVLHPLYEIAPLSNCICLFPSPHNLSPDCRLHMYLQIILMIGTSLYHLPSSTCWPCTCVSDAS